MSRHVKWDVRTGRDGAQHVTRTQVDTSTKSDGTKVTKISTVHTKNGAR